MLGLIVLLQTLTLAVGGPPTSAEYLPIWVAAADGHFARQGVRVTVRMTRSEVGAAEALAQSQVDLAATSLEALLRFGSREGQNPRLLLGLTAAPPVVLAAGAGRPSGVRAVGDLAGKRVGLGSVGAVEHAWLMMLLARARLTLPQIHLVNVGPDGFARTLADGEVHAVFAPEPEASRLLADPKALVLADLRTPVAARQALGVPTVNAAVFVRAERRPGERELAAFSRAILAAQDRLGSGMLGDLATRLPRNVVGADAEDFEARVRQARALYLPEGLVTPAQIEATVGLLRDHLPLPPRGRVQVLPTGRVRTTSGR